MVSGMSSSEIDLGYLVGHMERVIPEDMDQSGGTLSSILFSNSR
jgi:hypothetical protein